GNRSGCVYRNEVPHPLEETVMNWMHPVRARGLVAVGLALVLASVAFAEDKKVRVEQEWKGGSNAKADDGLWKKAPEGGALAGPKALEKLWKAWNVSKEVPKIDLEKELLLVFAGPGPNIITISDLVLNDKGDLKFNAAITERDGPGFVYKIIKVKRDGIKTVNGKAIPKE